MDIAGGANGSEPMASGRPEMERHALTKDRHGAWYGAAFLLAGLLAAIGAWRVIRHHDGFLLLGLPLAVLVVFGALRARRPSGGADT